MSTIPSTPIRLSDLTLANGGHGPEYQGESCLVETANLIAAGRIVAPPEWMPPCPLEPAAFSDDHPSISRVVRSYAIGLNDAWTDTGSRTPPELLTQLRDFAPRLLCTATGEADEGTRAWMATDWLARVHTPAFLRLAGLEEHARALEGLARIADATTARAAQPTLDIARSAAAAAWAAARDAAWDAARDAAWAAARDAGAAAGAAAWAAGDAAWAAGAAAGAAAWAAGDAAWAARAAARDAARDRLEPVVAPLRESALVLLEQMIAVGRGGAA